MLSKFLFRLKQVIAGSAAEGYHIWYNGNVRSGDVYYAEGSTRLCFHQELGGGRCMMYIDVPAPDQWERITHTPLVRRNEILERIARHMQKISASGWKYEIQDQMIYYFH
jgi:hypothetical protein